jgi:hypothetical protein
MEKSLTRKQFLANTSKMAAAVAVGAGAMTTFGPKAFAGTAATPWPWPYQKLDPERVRVLGHDSYYSGKGCAYGAFHALMAELRTVVGEPFLSLPSEIMVFGAGGAVGWGTLCGALNGAAALISLVTLKATSDILVNELLGWYTQVMFPTDISNQYAVAHTFTDTRYDQALPQNISGSVLCHVSNTAWCEASQFSVSSTERKERCARLTGDVAAYAAKILNDNVDGTFVALYVPPATIATCNTCHTTIKNNVAAKMECAQCHGDPHAPTQGVNQIDPVGSTYALRPNYPNPFNPSTKLQFSIPKSERVELSVYDVHGRLVKTLIDHQEFSPGTFAVDWDGTDENNLRVASGIYFSRIQAGTFSATQKMVLVK